MLSISPAPVPFSEYEDKFLNPVSACSLAIDSDLNIARSRDEVISERLFYDNLRNKSRNLLQEIISENDDRAADSLFEKIREIARFDPDSLRDIALDPNEVLTLRGQAARCFVAIFGKDSSLEPSLREIRESENTMVRLGALLGYEDSDNFAMVETFIEDPFPNIAREAREILEDAVEV
jgi:hypothetical protein